MVNWAMDEFHLRFMEETSTTAVHDKLWIERLPPRAERPSKIPSEPELLGKTRRSCSRRRSPPRYNCCKTSISKARYSIFSHESDKVSECGRNCSFHFFDWPRGKRIHSFKAGGTRHRAGQWILSDSTVLLLLPLVRQVSSLRWQHGKPNWMGGQTPRRYSGNCICWAVPTLSISLPFSPVPNSFWH